MCLFQMHTCLWKQTWRIISKISTLLLKPWARFDATREGKNKEGQQQWQLHVSCKARKRTVHVFWGQFQSIILYWQPLLKHPYHLRVAVENDCSCTVEEMKSLNSSKSHRLFDFVPSVKPSVVSVMLFFVCGCLWVKNETTNERLMALESRLHCFSCVKSVSTENLEKMTLSPTKDGTEYHYKNLRTPISEGIGHTYTGGV